MNRKDTNGLIILSSKDSTSKDISNSNFEGYFSLQGLKSYGLRSYNLTINLPNIGDLNNTAYIDTGTQTFPITIANGYYTYDELAIEVSAKMSALGLGVFTVTLTSGYNFIITSTSAIPFKFIKPVNYHTDWAQMMGMEINGLFNISQGGGIVDISYTDVIYITSNTLNSYKDRVDVSTSQRITNVLGVVYPYHNEYITGTDGPPQNGIKHITYVFESPKLINLQSNIEYRNVDIHLLDADGAPLPRNTIKFTIELITQ